MFVRSYQSAFFWVFTVLLVGTVGGVVYNAYTRTADAILDVSEQVMEQGSERIIDRVRIIFGAATHYLYIDGQLVTGRSMIDNQDELLRVFWSQVRLVPQIVSVHGADAQGNFLQTQELPQMLTRVIERVGDQSSERIIYRDTDFQPIAHIRGEAAFDPRQREWFQQTSGSNRVRWSPVYRFHTHDTPGVTASLAITNPNSGELRAVLGADISLDALSAFLFEQPMVPGGVALIVDQADRLVAVPGELAMLDRVAGEQPPDRGLYAIEDLALPWVRTAYREYKETVAQHGDDARSFTVTLKGQRYVGRVQPFPLDLPVQWKLFVVVPEEALLTSAQRILSESLVISAIILIVALAVVLTLAVHFSSPVRKLARNTELIRAFRFEDVEPVRSRFREIQALQDSNTHLQQGLAAMRKFVPRQLARHLLETGEEVRLGGEVRTITLLCSQFTHFKDLCRSLEPEEVTAMLNDHMREFSQIIDRERGTIERFSGDRVVSFWGAPRPQADAVQRACRAALTCHHADQEEDRRLQAVGKAVAPNVFALHRGDAIVGNVGSEDRMSYTVIGGTVDIANRVRELNLVYGTRIIATETVHDSALESFRMRLLDIVRVGEERTPLRLFELIGPVDEPLAPKRLDFIGRYETGFDAYLRRDWDYAVDVFDALARDWPDDPSVQLLLTRCVGLVESPPDESGEWTGAATFPGV